MSEKDINKEAYKQAEKEMLENRVKEVKGYILETLEKIEAKKKEKAKVEEELRVLKLDIEDLRNGNFDKIDERIEKSSVARGVSVIIHNHNVMPLVERFPLLSGSMNDIATSTLAIGGNGWLSATAGTYETTSGNAFYLSAN